jgi:hypothetical protein
MVHLRCMRGGGVGRVLAKRRQAGQHARRSWL